MVRPVAPCPQSLKLVLSAVMLAQQMLSNPVQLLADAPLSEFASYAIPGLIYFVNNNCLFYILQVRAAGRKAGDIE
jgi:hypothetical protein